MFDLIAKTFPYGKDPNQILNEISLETQVAIDKDEALEFLYFKL
jgi:hypothetical protein